MQDPVAVLLRVDHPDHLVDQAEQPVHLEPVPAFHRVEVGQVEQHQPAQRRLVVAVQRALPDEPLPWQHADPVEQPVGRARAGPRRRRARRRWSAGVRPTGDSFSRASALNRLDLPLPVLPASATTVWSRESASRLPARSTSVCAATRSPSGRYGSTTRRNRDSASSRSTSCSASTRPSSPGQRVADLLHEAHGAASSKGARHCGGQREFSPGAFHIGGGPPQLARRARAPGRPPRCGPCTGPPPRRAAR